MGITVYHNARCGKSREALAKLEALKVPYKIREYLNEPLSEAELESLIKKLGIKPKDLVRTGEPIFQKKIAGRKIYGKEWIRILAKNPVLIQRPVVEKDDKAIIARPAELIADFLK